MNIRVTMLLLALAGLMLAAGCDVPPTPPRTSGGEVVTGLIPLQPEEARLAQEFENAEAEYDHRLQVLQAYYDRTGAYAKKQWTATELANIERARTFDFVDIEPADPAAGPDLSRVGESTLVESVLASRQHYLDTLDALRAYYTEQGYPLKARLVQNIRGRFDPVRAYQYFLEAEVPAETLRPTAVVPEAERLFAQARQLYREGSVLPGIVDYNKQRRALELFVQLVQDYPSSTRIPEAAYHIGEIYRRFFDQYYRAALWYERAWQWDETIQLPARYRAATVADFRLNNRSRALELYRQALRHDVLDNAQRSLAQRRIYELTTVPPPAAQ